MDNRELIMLQSLPLDIKIAKTKLRIREAIEHFGVDHVYVSISGGINSTNMDDIVAEVQKEDGIPREAIPRVNCNTGNEYDGVLAKARELSDAEVKPVRPFYQVITEEGYPIGSKKVSRMLRDIQNPTKKNKATVRLYKTGIKSDGTKSKHFKLPYRWNTFIDSAVRASEKCCFYVKKEPLYIYEKKTGRHPFVAVTAEEGGTREQGYLQTGCNAFEGAHPQSKCKGFWTNNDELMYGVLKGIKYPPEYGEIVFKDTGIKVTKEDVQKAIEEGRILNLTTTLEKRTGCVCCTFGVTMEKGENRFQRMKRLYPKRYKFCIYGGEIKDGKLVPKMGLGLGYILDKMGIPYDDNGFHAKSQLSMYDSKKDERILVGNSYINKFNGVVAMVIEIDKDTVLCTQICKDKLSFNMKFDLDCITYLINDGTWKKHILTKDEIEIGLNYSEEKLNKLYEVKPGIKYKDMARNAAEMYRINKMLNNKKSIRYCG